MLLHDKAVCDAQRALACNTQNIAVNAPNIAAYAQGQTQLISCTVVP